MEVFSMHIERRQLLLMCLLISALAALFSERMQGGEGGQRRAQIVFDFPGYCGPFEMVDAQYEYLTNAIAITFVGDLILLQDAVLGAWNKGTGAFDFANVFSLVENHWQHDDYTIGVFEGPMAGPEGGWSRSNYDDGIPLSLNFPDEYALAVKRAGIDLVTTANNHLLDRGISGALRTLDVLDCIGLDHAGSYRSESDHAILKIVDIQGKKVAVLPYTYGSNGCSEETMFSPIARNLTHVIVPPRSDHLEECLRSVENDFAKARAACVDLIIVLPHMGAQFRHQPDEMQLFWCDQFVKLGAGIVFSDHPHAVQPIEWRSDAKGGNVLVVHCPGNFVNSYAPHDGDASMYVTAYLDRNRNEPVAASFVPVYAHVLPGGLCVAEPCYLMKGAATPRLEEVQKVVTRSATGVEIPIENARERYYLFPNRHLEVR